jgi:hypothetical protein
MRITNVAVSVPLQGISSGGSYGHPGLARAPPRVRHRQQHLQGGSLHDKILLLTKQEPIPNCQFIHQPAIRFRGEDRFPPERVSVGGQLAARVSERTEEPAMSAANSSGASAAAKWPPRGKGVQRWMS